MEHKLSTHETRMAQLLFQMKVLEGKFKNKKARGLMKINKIIRKQVTHLENQMKGLELRYVLHFHHIPYVPYTLSCPLLPSTLLCGIVTNAVEQSPS